MSDDDGPPANRGHIATFAAIVAIAAALYAAWCWLLLRLPL